MRAIFSGNILALLTVLFVGLKLTNQIDWSWLWVVSPLWLPVAIVLSFFLGIILIGACGMVVYSVAQLVVNAITYRERRA